MKKYGAFSYRVKLILIWCVVILLITGLVSLALTYSATRQMLKDQKAHLELLTEQVLINFINQTEAVSRQLSNQINSTGLSAQLYAMRNMTVDSNGYYHATQSLLYALNQIITAQAGYDAVYLHLDQGSSFTTAYASAEFRREAAALMEQKELRDTAYGRSQWRTSENGQVYLIRDVYNPNPFRHMGKLVARVKQEELGSLGSYNDSLHCAVAFLDEDGRTLTVSGEQREGVAQAAEEAARTGASELQGSEKYYVSIQKQDGWTAVGLLPESILRQVRRTAVLTGTLTGLLGAALGSLLVLMVTERMTRQIHLLVGSVDEAAAGNLELRVPVVSGDEIGKLASHFNRMLEHQRRLLIQVREEETRKNRAEYEMLEYKYRSLQSQINPHFIYNAMEMVNALAKIDGNTEICEVVQHISSFFRQNTGNMQKRFIPVKREFDSLKQYAYIYRHIHGEKLETPFHCTPGAAFALIPTMILQPVLENALVHGVRTEHSVVDISARDEDGRLIIRVQDNGEGMPPERVERILSGSAEESEQNGRKSTGIGMRNVRDRLQLIYGSAAELRIESQVGEGTVVTILLPLAYEEKDWNLHGGQEK